MSRKYPNSVRQRGFTLIEATISLTLLLIILAVSMALLFSMRNFSQKQQFFTSPRQSARRAMEYITHNAMQASDMNYISTPTNPNALLMYFYKGSGSTPIQATFNNLTSSQASAGYGDAGTDIINMEVPTGGMLINILNWPGGQHAANLRVEFDRGCPSNAANMQLFKQMTGYDSSTGKSGILTLIDDNGNWGFYQITNYQQVDCTASPPEIHVINNPGQSDGINPPGGQPNLNNPKIASTAYMCLRVKNNQLQQRNGIFYSTAPDAGFYTLMDNVEDLQVAYIFQDGTIWNNTPTHRLTTANNVPGQVGMGGTAPLATDITNVIGLRFTVVARSNSLPVTILQKNKFFRPAAEDHAAGLVDNRYHYRLTSTVMIRNRMLGG